MDTTSLSADKLVNICKLFHIFSLQNKLFLPSIIVQEFSVMKRDSSTGKLSQTVMTEEEVEALLNSVSLTDEADE